MEGLSVLFDGLELNRVPYFSVFMRLCINVSQMRCDSDNSVQILVLCTRCPVRKLLIYIHPRVLNKYTSKSTKC